VSDHRPDRVLEIGGFAAGHAGRLFALAGHEVVRVDRGGSRPAWVSEAAMDLHLHRGKERIATDDPGRIAELADRADVVVAEAETADRLAALGFDRFRTAVRVGLTPYGRTGPRRNQPATAATLLAMGGATRVMGDPDRAPLSLPGHYVEAQAGALACAAACGSRRAGRRDVFDIGLLEVVMACSQYTSVLWHCAGRIRERHGSDYWTLEPSDLFRLRDGWAYVNVPPNFWDAFAVFLDRPELVLDPRFRSNDTRMTHRDALRAIVAGVLGGWSRATVEARAAEARVPVGVVRSLDEVLADPQLAACDAWDRVGTGTGTVQAPGLPWRSRAPAAAPARRPPSPPPPPRPAEAMRAGPLQGIRILDLTHVWAGPLATRTLADLGAEVVKVEAPWSRGPLHLGRVQPLGGWIGGEPGDEPWNTNAIFVKLQRNKRSLCLDLESGRGRALFLELVAHADVVADNFSAGTLESLGLGDDALRAARPDLVSVALPGFGAGGPYAERAAFGTIIEPMCGLTTVFGYGPEEPRNTASAIPDPAAGLHASAAILLALRRRDATGEGVRVELPLLEAGVALCAPFLVEHQLGGDVGRRGNRHPRMAPHGVFRCADEDAWLAVACRDDADWRALCGAVGGGLAGLPGLALEARKAREDEIDAALETWTRARERDGATDVLLAAGVPAGSVNATPDLTGDPQVRARGFFVPLDGGVPMPGNPIHGAGLSSEDWTPCPRLGADNRGVLRDWLGYDDARIDALERQGVLADRPPA